MEQEFAAAEAYEAKWHRRMTRRGSTRNACRSSSTAMTRRTPTRQADAAFAARAASGSHQTFTTCRLAECLPRY